MASKLGKTTGLRRVFLVHELQPKRLAARAAQARQQGLERVKALGGVHAEAARQRRALVGLGLRAGPWRRVSLGVGLAAGVHKAVHGLGLLLGALGGFDGAEAACGVVPDGELQVDDPGHVRGVARVPRVQACEHRDFGAEFRPPSSCRG